MHMGKTGTTGKRDLVTYQDPMPIYNSYMVLSKKGNKKSKSQGARGNQHPVNLLRLKILLKQVKWSRILVQWALPEWGCKRYNLTSLPFSRPLVTFQGGSKIVTVVTLIITVIIAIIVFIMNSFLIWKGLCIAQNLPLAMQGPIVVSGFVMSIIVLSQLWDILASIFVLNALRIKFMLQFLGWCGDNIDEGIASIKIGQYQAGSCKTEQLCFSHHPRIWFSPAALSPVLQPRLPRPVLPTSAFIHCK